MNNELSSIKLPLAIIGALVLLLLIGIVFKSLIVGAPVVRLQPAPALYGQVSQTLLIGTGGNKILSDKNFTLQNPVYFDSNSWVVVRFIPKDKSGDNATVVMQKIGPFYQVVLGPGTEFPSNDQGLPSDVYSYLQSKGLIDAASN
jgi:hypothetical protein